MIVRVECGLQVLKNFWVVWVEFSIQNEIKESKLCWSLAL